MFVESLILELKREFSDNIIKTVIAFANTDGGSIYVGINDDGSVCGVADTDFEMQRITSAIRGNIKPDVLMFVSIKAEALEGKDVIKITVQKGTNKPYYLIGKGIRPEGVFVRSGVATIQASEEMIRAMIRESDNEFYEEAVSLNQNLTFESTQKAFSQKGIELSENHKKTLGLINDDGFFTNLALLLSDQCKHTIKCALFQGEDTDEFMDRREFGGSLFDQVSEVFDYIKLNNKTKSVINGLTRQDSIEYPPNAVREALMNAILHRDYSFRDSSAVNIYSNRIEFISIGGLLRGYTLENMEPGLSIRRNPKLADIFARLGFVEAYGTGLARIRKEYNDSREQPKFRTTNITFSAILPNRNNQKGDTSRIKYRNEIVSLFNTHKEIDRKLVEKSLGISTPTATRALNALIGSGEIQKVGSGKNTKYVR